MAQQRVHLERERFSCAICLDLLKNPGTLSCGHSYCIDCINNHWDKEEEKKKFYSCPQCREAFTPRPKLMKSTMLADLVEELKKSGLRADLCAAGATDVACDSCTGRKLNALKSCLVCLASFCEEHLQPHYQSPAFKKHKLVEPSKNLQENICPRHNEVMKMFCRTDQMRICYLCSVDEHQDHDTVSAAAERTQKQRKLDLSREEIQHRSRVIDRDVKVLQEEVEALALSADKAMNHTDQIFYEMTRLLQRISSGVKQQITSQHRTERSRVKGLQEKLQQESAELKKRDDELKQLSLIQDHNQFLLNYNSLLALSPSTHSSTINVRPLRHFEDVAAAAVAEVSGQLLNVLTKTWTNISLAVTRADVLLTEPEPKTRAEFLRYSQEITLDPNTAHTQLLLSEGNRGVTSTNTDRFTDYLQFLSKESLTARCYWEVEWTGRVCVAVAYEDISRSGDVCRLGFNDDSWSLDCQQNYCEFVHKRIQTKVSDDLSSRVGVYLDHRAGLLSFYSVSDTMTLIHRVQTTFTQPLYAGVHLYYDYGNTVEFCKLT